MSSRLFVNIRERQGLAGNISSALSGYRDAGLLTIYASCVPERVNELMDATIDELRLLKTVPIPSAELRRAKDHLKASLMLNLENTSSRMSHLARKEIYQDFQFELKDTIHNTDQVTTSAVHKVAWDLFRNDTVSATILGEPAGSYSPERRL